MARVRQRHAAPELTAVVLTRLYERPSSLQDAICHLARDSPLIEHLNNTLVQRGDSKSFRQQFLSRTLVCLASNAPPLQQQSRLSQRFTLEEVTTYDMPTAYTVNIRHPAVVRDSTCDPYMLHVRMSNCCDQCTSSEA